MTKKSIFEKYEVDLELELEGVWVELDDDISIRIRPLGNKEWSERLEKEKRPYRNQYRKGTINPDIDEKNNMIAFCAECLLDWKGVIGKDGKEIKYSPDVAFGILQNAAMKYFKADCLESAMMRDLFKADDVYEDSVKNLKKSSSGT